MHVPRYIEIEYHEPLDLFAHFAPENGAIFLDSSQPQGAETTALNRYSFIAVDPFQIMHCKNDHVQIGAIIQKGNPFLLLQEQLAHFPLVNHAELPPFQGGVAGYFGYELYQHNETLALPAVDALQFDDMVLGFYDLVLAYDHQQKRAWVFSSGYPEKTAAARAQRAEQRLSWILSITEKAAFLPPLVAQADPQTITANFTAAAYQAAVARVQEYILAGDIFEANIAQGFAADLPADVSPFMLYRKLRSASPAPFAAYLQFADIVIASASPERFLQCLQRLVQARPIKGTAPRGATQTEDIALAAALSISDKDRAENIMIVDLLRNDLSRVCTDDSVCVEALCQVETYAQVHHLVSIVTGKLLPDKDVIDLLMATFPGGSITGAPKIRAMEIITEIEAQPRGPYCGSAGYIGFNGDMDLSILIRTFAIKNQRVTFQAGGAVILDSDAAAEYQEVLTKSSALRQVLNDMAHCYDETNSRHWKDIT